MAAADAAGAGSVGALASQNPVRLCLACRESKMPSSRYPAPLAIYAAAPTPRPNKRVTSFGQATWFLGLDALNETAGNVFAAT